MEPTQQSHQPSEDTNVGNGSGSKGSFLCRQSSSRWTPTTDQIRILKDLYYNNGIRSPNADQIHRISARLRQYGKIEGKNVFYWFQNHKARERQKKRYTPDHQLIAPANNTSTNLQQQQPVMRRSNNNLSTIIDSSTAPTWKPDGLDHPHDTKFPISCIANSVTGFPAGTSSPAGLVGVGQIGSYGYGPKTMEKSFRECSISSHASSTIMGSRSQNYGWITSNTNYDPFIPSYGFYEYQPPRGSVELLKHHREDDSEDEEYEDEELGCQVETLPLFPMHHEDHCNGGYFSNNFKTPSSNNNINHSSYYFGNNGGGSCTSLELSLNSLFGHSHDAL